MAETDSAKLIGAAGECLLVLSKSDLYLVSATTKTVVGVWPYNSLRRYYCIEGMFGFVAGRRSPRGEGEFKFVTSEKEDIYHRLERAILRAKRGVQGSSSSAEEVKTVDSRPPAPIPDSQQEPPPRQETPVQTSESDEDIFRNSPTFSPTLKEIVGETAASEISPAYGRFGSNGSRKSVGKGGTRGQSSPSLHESVSVVPQPQESSKRPIPDPQATRHPSNLASRNSQISMIPVASEEDTYSHTIHSVPEQFKKKSIEHNVVGGSMYNALVHQRPQITHRKSSRPASDADSSLYDVAFPEGRKVISSGEYATARHPDAPQYTPGAPRLPPRRMASMSKVQPRWDAVDGAGNEAQHQQQLPQKSQEAKKPPRSPSPPPPPPPTSSSGAVKNGKQNGDDHGMTKNPMYGSKDNLLTEFAILNMQQQFRELERDSSISVAYSGRVVHTSTGAASVLAESLEMVDDEDEMFTPNPVYGELEEAQRRRFLEKGKCPNSSSEEAVASTGHDKEGGESHKQIGVETFREVVESNSLLCESDQGLAQSRQERRLEGVSQSQRKVGEEQERKTSHLSPDTTDELAAANEQPSAVSTSDGGIQRDAKGYSKVDKSKKLNGNATSVDGREGGDTDGSTNTATNSASGSREGSVKVLSAVPTLEEQNDDEAPPPLPERNYSFDESELNQSLVIS